jgi:hypothetical protein
MATANPQGIMALPAESASAQPQLGLDDSYDAVQQGLQNASPDAYAAVNAELGKLAPALDQLPDETLDQLLQIVQYMHDNPNEYAQCLKDMIEAGIVSEGDFPEEYDPEFLATVGMVIMQARKTRQGAQGAAPVTPAPIPPAGMARGSSSGCIQRSRQRHHVGAYHPQRSQDASCQGRHGDHQPCHRFA